MKVKDVLPQQVITAEADTSLMEIARRMRNHRIGIVPILQNNQLIGVLTDRDIVVRANAATASAGLLRAQDVMTRKPVTINEEEDVEEAAVLMRSHRLHRIVAVRDNGTVAGIVSLTDLSLLSDDALQVLRRLSEHPIVEQFPEEDVKMPSALLFG